MDMRPGEILRQIAKTAALCGVLGLLLYGAIMMLAERDDGPWLIGLALAAPMTALIGHQVIDALRSGQLPMRGGALPRESQPLAFWSGVVWFGVCGVLLGALTVWCIMRLLGAS